MLLLMAFPSQGLDPEREFALRLINKRVGAAAAAAARQAGKLQVACCCLPVMPSLALVGSNWGPRGGPILVSFCHIIGPGSKQQAMLTGWK